MTFFKSLLILGFIFNTIPTGKYSISGIRISSPEYDDTGNFVIGICCPIWILACLPSKTKTEGLDKISADLAFIKAFRLTWKISSNWDVVK